MGTGTRLVTTPGSSSWYPVAWRAALLGCWLVSGAAYGGSITVAPRVTLSGNYSTNMSLGASAGQEGVVGNVAPGVLIESNGAHLKGYLDYQLNSYFYPGHSRWNGSQNQLASHMTLEAIDNWLFVDAAANIFQRQRSLFGPVAVEGSNSATGQGDSKFGQVSPYVRGQLFGSTDYQLRLNLMESQSAVVPVTTTHVQQLLGNVGTRATTGTIGWFGDFNATRLSNDVVGDRENTRGRIGLAFPVFSQIHGSVSTGRERTDYATGELESVSTPGFGIQWAPDRHTEVAVVRERRFFGMGHNAMFYYRTRATAWRYSDVRDVTILPMLPPNAYSGTIHDMMADLLAGSYPDPVARAQAVRDRVAQVGAIDGMAGGGGASTSRLFVDRIREASFAYIGPRDYATVVFRRREERLLSTGATTLVDDFSLASEIRERGLSFSWGHRLTRTHELSLSSTRLYREGIDAPADLSMNQTTHGVSLTSRLSPKAVASFAAHRTKSNSSLAGTVRENAVGATLVQRF
ncbi:MAG: TIGR03016 family PEP-CTERM system-associated outer membrane protein [Rhodocyclales bacterium]|nr:TIGR03016 family PEP-CTERM system-associated outer membrane protein [Rhodocyclales bacterium]